MVNIYELKLHEELKISTDLSVIRVPGGWLYKTKHSTTFVPFVYDDQVSLSYEDQFNELKRKLERNLGEDWTKANKKDIIDVLLGVYIPF